MLVNAAVTSTFGVGVASRLPAPMLRRSVRLNCGAIGPYADSFACPLWIARCVASSRSNGLTVVRYGVFVSML